MPSPHTGPTQVTKKGNVGFVDVFRVAHPSTFGPKGQGISLRGSWMFAKNQQKIKEASGMPSLPIVPTQVALKGDSQLKLTIFLRPYQKQAIFSQR